MEKKKIVVLEDDPEIGELLEYLFRSENLEVDLCNRVSAFWVAMQDAKPDVILLDVRLPDGNGIDVCQQLKKNNHTGNIPVLLMSANYTAQDIQCPEADFIAKPFNIDELLGRIHKKIE